jgi:hypothetical protein
MSTDTEILYTDISQLTHLWAKDGLPIFVADIPDVIEAAKSIGFTFFYVMGTHSKVEKVKSTTTYTSTIPGKPANQTPATVDVVTKSTRFFKVISNIVGESIFEVENLEIEDYYVIDSSTVYNLPVIPKVMIDKLDQFFRAIEKSHDSEAIVLLTFDPSYEDSQGWGILVPEQENNAAHCSYDPISVAETKPDNVYIVGSVHSHPSMAAYASGTDHKDQVGFDGLHITFGWQPSVNNNATQYHIELQMGGKIFSLTPEQVFESDIYFEPDPEVLDWVTKVKKEFPPNFMGGTLQDTIPLLPKTTLTDSSSSQSKFTTPKSNFTGVKIHYEDLLPEYSLDNLGIIIAEVPDKINYPEIESFCPCCGSTFTQEDLWQGNCPDCEILISCKGDSINFIHKLIEDFCFSKSIKIGDHKAYLWGLDPDDKSWLMEISLPSELLLKYDPTSYGPVYESEDLDIYSDNAKCNSCAHFYGTSCPAYALAIEGYNLGKIDYDNLAKSVTGEDCSSYTPY